MSRLYPSEAASGSAICYQRSGLGTRMAKARQELGLQELETATPLLRPLERPATRIASQKIIYQSVVNKPRAGLPQESSQSR